MQRCATILLFSILTPLCSHAQDAHSYPAHASQIILSTHTPQTFQPSSSNGFIVLSLTDTTLLINNHPFALQPGDTRVIPGKQALTLEDSYAQAAPIVLVRIDTATQSLTITKTNLAPSAQSEDASDRNDTLVIALSPLTLRDVRDLGEEDEPWKSAPPATLSLSPGQTSWLNPGMHRLTNLAQTKASFVTIEW